MASFLVNRFASNLLRVRSVTSSSRFFSCTGYQYVQHDSKGACILKYDDKNGSSLVRGVVNDAFCPHVSPTENLARLLNYADWRVKYIHGTSHHRWSVVEDDKSLCISRDMSQRYYNQDVKEYVPNKESMSDIDEKNVKESAPNKESMTGIDEENVEESVPLPKEEVVSGTHEIDFKEYVPTRNVFPVIDIMRGNEYTPDEYYYHVMKDVNEVNQFIESLHGEAMGTVNRIVKGRLKTYGVVEDNPQALYIFIVFGDPETRGPYGGYAVEIFLDESFYDIYGIQPDFTGDNRKIVIPKKKSMGIETIGGNIIFFCEKKFYKPTVWRPTLDHVSYCIVSIDVLNLNVIISLC